MNVTTGGISNNSSSGCRTKELAGDTDSSEGSSLSLKHKGGCSLNDTSNVDNTSDRNTICLCTGMYT